MRYSPTICHIGKIGAVLGCGRISHPRRFLPLLGIDRGQMGIALGGGVHLVVVPVDYSENIRVLVDELRAAKAVSDAFSKE